MKTTKISKSQRTWNISIGKVDQTIVEIEKKMCGHEETMKGIQIDQ